jgi:uncharacterized DUF497 family protein
MQFVDDPATAEWLAQLASGSGDFDWDAGNRTKNRKHQVEQADIEALFRFPVLFVGRIIEPGHSENRWLVLGQNEGNRQLALVFTRRGHKLRPISCRPMRRNERRIYADALQENTETSE